jgi:hypothetical protein
MERCCSKCNARLFGSMSDEACSICSEQAADLPATATCGGRPSPSATTSSPVQGAKGRSWGRAVAVFAAVFGPILLLWGLAHLGEDVSTEIVYLDNGTERDVVMRVTGDDSSSKSTFAVHLPAHTFSKVRLRCGEYSVVVSDGSASIESRRVSVERSRIHVYSVQCAQEYELRTEYYATRWSPLAPVPPDPTPVNQATWLALAVDYGLDEPMPDTIETFSDRQSITKRRIAHKGRRSRFVGLGELRPAESMLGASPPEPVVNDAPVGRQAEHLANITRAGGQPKARGRPLAGRDSDAPQDRETSNRKTVTPSLHAVATPARGAARAGTGFFVSTAGSVYAVTAGHVNEDLGGPPTTFVGTGGRVAVGPVVFIRNDVQVLRVKGEAPAALQPGSLLVGPRGPLLILSPAGHVTGQGGRSGYGGSSSAGDLLEFRADIPFQAIGCSGAPVVDRGTGHAIGVVLTADNPARASYIGFAPLTLPQRGENRRRRDRPNGP